MKRYWMVILVAAFLAMASIAVAFTWTSELPSATTSTLGENQKREMLKTNITEIRTNVNTTAAAFAAYTSAMNARFNAYSTAHGQ